jgi:hypothetical protein
VLVDRDGSIRIAWHADGFEAIHVRARFRTPEELAGWARGIADEALLERTVRGLHARLRERYPGTFDLSTRQPAGQAGSVLITFHPPKGTPRPDD